MAINPNGVDIPALQEIFSKPGEDKNYKGRNQPSWRFYVSTYNNGPMFPTVRGSRPFLSARVVASQVKNKMYRTEVARAQSYSEALDIAAPLLDLSARELDDKCRMLVSDHFWDRTRRFGTYNLSGPASWESHLARREPRAALYLGMYLLDGAINASFGKHAAKRRKDPKNGWSLVEHYIRTGTVTDDLLFLVGQVYIGAVTQIYSREADTLLMPFLRCFSAMFCCADPGLAEASDPKVSDSIAWNISSLRYLAAGYRQDHALPSCEAAMERFFHDFPAL